MTKFVIGAMLLVMLLPSKPISSSSCKPGEKEKSTSTSHYQVLKKTNRVRATGYCLKGRMSSGVKVFPGACALSRDLVRELGLCPPGKSIFNSHWGSIIRLTGTEDHDGFYVFMDLMPSYQKRKIDLWLPTAKQCYALGFDKGNKIEVVEKR